MQMKITCIFWNRRGTRICGNHCGASDKFTAYKEITFYKVLCETGDVLHALEVSTISSK